MWFPALETSCCLFFFFLLLPFVLLTCSVPKPVSMATLRIAGPCLWRYLGSVADDV